MSTRQVVLDSVETRLKTITKANGYKTDAGLQVYMWRKSSFDSAEYPAILVVDPSVERGYDKASISTVETLLTIHVVVLGEGADNTRSIEEDVVKALGGWDITAEEFDWLFIPKTELVVEENNKETGAIQLTVVVEYDATYDEI